MDKPSGRVLSAWEVYAGFGADTLAGLAEAASYPLIARGGEISAAIKGRCDDLGVKSIALAQSDARFEAREVDEIVENKKMVKARTLTRVAETLAMDDFRLGAQPRGGGDTGLAYRLRDLMRSETRTTGVMTPSVVLALTEAAWVIRTQIRLLQWQKGKASGIPNLLRDLQTPLGTKLRPSWREGYALAQKTREILGIGPEEPIRNLPEIVEKKCNIPVIQCEIAGRFVGATISNNGDRGIALNVIGSGSNVFSRRMTLAHELAHLLCDPDEELRFLRVDTDNILHHTDSVFEDFIEARANAFAVEFLAPQQAVLKKFREGGSSQEAMAHLMDYFGISLTALGWQLQNADRVNIRRSELPKPTRFEPSDEWLVDTGRTADYFPVASTPVVRTGYFAKHVAQAALANIISFDTASEYLKMQHDEELPAEPEIRPLLEKVSELY